jgi:hypothetical protein
LAVNWDTLGTVRMARKKRKGKRFEAVKAVKALARERVGTPRPTVVAPDRKKDKREKHKKTLGKMLGELGMKD